MIGSMFRKAWYSDSATLNLDFTTGVLDSRLTFTRSSTATYIDSSGYVASASIDSPRFDHDPSTLAPKGLLIEGQATNLLQRSEAVDQSPWFVAGTVVRATFTGGNGPNGVNNSGSKLSATNISASSSLYYNGVSLTAQTYTMSVFAKADGADWIWINVQSGGTIHGAFFDLSGNGALGNTTGTVVSGSNIITKYPNGWFRIQFTFTGTAATWFPVLLPCTSNGTGYASIAGQAPNGVLVYGAQLETGSGASSYIPTGASTATRALDSCVMTGTNFTSWFAGATEGVLYAEHERPRSESGNTTHDHASVGSRYTSGGLFSLYVVGIPTLYPTTLLWTTGGALFAGGISSAVPANTKAAARWFNGNDATNFSNGVQGTTGNGSGTVTPTMLCIGAHSTDGIVASRDFLNACVRQVKFWPVALPDSQIIAITTP